VCGPELKIGIPKVVSASFNIPEVSIQYPLKNDLVLGPLTGLINSSLKGSILSSIKFCPKETIGTNSKIRSIFFIV
jgi:hypothetical protein